MFQIENTQKHPITVSFITIDGFRKSLKFNVGKNTIDAYDKMSLDLEENKKYISLKKAKMLKDVIAKEEKPQPKKQEVKKVAIGGE